MALLVHGALCAQWSDNPSENNRITAVDRVVYGSSFEVNKDGVTYVYFNGPNNEAGELGGSVVTFLQIIDKEGNKLFPDEGKVISRERAKLGTYVNDWLMVDRQGNALITVSDCRNSPSDVKNLSYSIYKVSPAGDFLWGDMGVDLERGHCNVLESKMTMVQLEDDSYVFAWVKTDGIRFRVQMERVSAEGALLWEESIILEDNEQDITWPYLANAGDNQFILVYAKGSDQEMMARKFDFDGSPVWSQDTRICTAGSASGSPLHTYFSVLPDHNGGIFAGWYSGPGGREKTYVSHVTSDGQLAFPGGELGLIVGNTPNNKSFEPQLLFDRSENCLFVIWRETDPYTQTAQRLMMQRISGSGELEWGEEGLPIVPLQDKLAIGYYSIQAAGDNQFAAFYMTRDAVKETTLGYAVKVDGANGDFVWENKERVFSASDNGKGGLTSGPLVDGAYWLTQWDDFRSITGDEAPGEGRVYMQRMNVDGTFGNLASIQAIETGELPLQAYISEEGTIEFHLTSAEAGTAELSIHSITGQKVAVVQQGYLEEGTHSILWDANLRLAKGVYLATYLTSRGNTHSARIVIK